MAPSGLQEEIISVRAAVSGISRRLDLLELRAHGSEGSAEAGDKESASATDLPNQDSISAATESQSAPQPRVLSKLLDSGAVSKPEKKDVELQIGTVWLNRVGIGSLVLGIVFLLLYSVQFFGVAAKLMIGYLASTALIFGGEKICQQKGRDWYGSALIGGGWSLMYFTAFAMHFVPSLKVIDSLAAELLILCGISAGAMRHAVYKDSQTLAILATVLGVVAILFGNPSNLSYVGYLGITSGAAFIAVKRKWFRVLNTASIACFSAHFFTSISLVNNSVDPLAASVWSMVALLASWLVFNTALARFAKFQPEKQSDFLVMHWINAIYTTFAIFQFSNGALKDFTYLFFITAAICYLVSAHLMSKEKLNMTADAHTFFGLSLVTLAIGNKVPADYLALAYLTEAVTLAEIHIRNKEGTYGTFAALIMVLAFGQWFFSSIVFWGASASLHGIASPVKFINGVLAVIACAGLAYRYNSLAVLDKIAATGFRDWTNQQLHDAYALLANLFAMTLPMLIIGVDNRVLCWLTISCTNSIIYFKNKMTLYRGVGNSALLITTLASSFLIMKEVSAMTVATSLMVFIFDWIAAHLDSEYKSSLRWFGQAAMVIALALVMQLPLQMISVGLGLLGLSSLIVGFGTGVKIYRGWALGTLGLLSLRLVFVDLAHENTLERIIAFTASGAILLLGSYAYAKFGDRKASTPGA